MIQTRGAYIVLDEDEWSWWLASAGVEIVEALLEAIIFRIAHETEILRIDHETLPLRLKHEKRTLKVY